MVNPSRKLKKIFMITGITGAVYAGFRYLLPLVLPFLCAYLTAVWLRTPVRFLERHLRSHLSGCGLKAEKSRIGRFFIRQANILPALMGTLLLLFLFGSIAALCYLGGRYLLSQFQQFYAGFPQWISALDVHLTEMCRHMERRFGLREQTLVTLIRSLLRQLGETVSQASMPFLMNNSMTVFRVISEILVFLLLFFVSVILILKEMEEIRERRSNSMFHREISLFGRRLASVGNAWLKTQVIIMAITAVICTIGFWVMGNPYALLLGIGIGIVDAFPLFGSGLILLPWGIWKLIQKQWVQGGILIAVYILCYGIRQILEAKIMGDQVGLSALETLISMYIGLKLFGIAGVFLGPIGLLLIEDFFQMYWAEMGE